MHVDDLVTHLKSIGMETEAEVQHAVSHAAACERAIVFVDVGWAPMREDVFAQFVLDYKQSHPDDNLAVHYVDCTQVFGHYRPLRALDGWDELERARGGRLLHGWGEIVWLEQGRVLHVGRIWDFKSAAELLTATERWLPDPRDE